MPLSAAKPREQFHNRTLDIKGYRRQDGLWDIEGHLCDVKPAAVDRAEPGRAAGEPIHEMWLRLTIDERLMIHEAEAFTERSPYRICPDAAPNFARLAGIRIGAGCEENGISYSRFIHGLNLAGITLDRKVLADMALHDMPSFAKIVEQAKAKLAA